VPLPTVDVEGVERVEVLIAAGPGDLQREQAAGRRVRADIGEMRKVRRQGEIAERRQPMRLDRIVGERDKRAAKERCDRPASARGENEARARPWGFRAG